MKKLDQFILKSFIGPFIAILLVVVFILIMQFLWLYIDELVGKGLSFKVVLEFLGWGSVTMLPLSLPLATLLASMMTMGTLGENNELLAIKAAGISLQRILVPLFSACAVISIGAFFVSNNLMPVAFNNIYQLREDIGKTKEEIVDYLNHVYERDRAYFIVDDLTTLQKGGRIKATTMVITKLLDIKPILRTDNGKVEAFEKVKGLKKAISKMVNIAVENMTDPENGEVVLLSNEADDKLEIAKKMVEDKLNPKKISTYDVGPIITCHAGMGVIGIFFEHKETEE